MEATMTLVRRDESPADDAEVVLRNLGGVMPTGKSGQVERPPVKADEVVEAEVLDVEDEQPPIRAWSRRLPAPVQRAASGKTAERAAITAVGMASLAGRAWDGATHGVYRRQIKAAEATGNGEALEKWTVLKEAATQRRHERLRHLPGMAFGMFAVAVLAVVSACFGSFVVAVFAPLFGHSFAGTLFFWLRLVGVMVYAVVGLLLVIMAAAPVVIVAASYREGQRRGDKAPAWLTVNRPGEEDAVIVTPLGVAEAINHLSIQSLDKAIRDGWQIAFDTPPMRVNNRGYQTVFSLPMGVTPTMVADKREVLARNLHRDTMEVWPTAAERPGFVDLWVADSGSAARPTPEYPLLHDGQADVFDGVPVGVAQRGDEIMFPVVGANFVAGGQMGQGKSNLCRVVMLGCATDPLADLWVHVFAGNGDFDAYRPRLARYLRGADDDIIWAGLQSLQELYEETGRREARLAELGAKKVTRGLADKHPDLRPIIALFSECHELFGSDLPLYDGAPKSQTVGRAAAEYATKTVKRARKTGITLGFDTQSSRADAIPPKIVELVGVNACFSVKTWRSNDGFLGDGSFQAGIRATELRFNVDRGTCLVTGTTDETFEVMKTFFIEVDDDAGRDDAAPVIARCMAEVKDVARLGGGAERPAIESRDLLEDVAAVLAKETAPVPVADVPARLRTLAPGWQAYRSMTGKDLRKRLDEEYGLVVPSTGNRYPVNPDAVRAVLSDRHLEEPDLTG
jgi:S-DNA-T family DNA segregation ATPase FtsK/SpoIIIE